MDKGKILFVTLPERGHINPLIGVAKCLLDMNFGIAFFSQADISDQLEKAKIDCECYTSNEHFVIPAEFMAHGASFAERIKDKEWLQQWIKILLIDSVPSQVNALGEVVEAYKPDVILSDPMVYATSIVAESKKIPWAGISNSLNPVTPKDWGSDLIETLDKYQSERLALFSSLQRDVKFCVCDLISPWLNIVFTSELYAPRNLSKNDFSFYVGSPFPLDGKRGDETAFPFEKLDKHKKKVYMSLGSMVYYHPILFKTVYKALEGFNVQLILSVGDLYFENFANNFSKDTIVLPYVPQLQLLEHIDLMVSHGGANSVLECLSKGIPLALLPICNDQFFQAKFLNRAETGIVLDANNPDVKVYREGLTRLLKDNNIYRKNAQLIKESLNNSGGVHKVAALACELLKTGQPLKPIFS